MAWEKNNGVDELIALHFSEVTSDARYILIYIALCQSSSWHALDISPHIGPTNANY